MGFMFTEINYYFPALVKYFEDCVQGMFYLSSPSLVLTKDTRDRERNALYCKKGPEDHQRGASFLLCLAYS